jgi:hypothetical protein
MKERIEEYFYNLAVTLGLTLDEFSVKVLGGPYYAVHFSTNNSELETILVNSLKEHLDITTTHKHHLRMMCLMENADFDNTYVLKFKI